MTQTLSVEEFETSGLTFVSNPSDVQTIVSELTEAEKAIAGPCDQFYVGFANGQYVEIWGRFGSQIIEVREIAEVSEVKPAEARAAIDANVATILADYHEKKQNEPKFIAERIDERKVEELLQHLVYG